MANGYYDNQTTPAASETVTEENTNLSDNNENQEATDNITSFPDDSSGKLTVSVFTANQLVPVVGAEVSVLSGDGNSENVLGTSTTDRSGRTTTFTLPAPNFSASQEPTALSPFAVYRVRVSHPDFYDFVAENVQVFGDIVTQLPVNLIPLPELPNGERTKIVIIPNQNL